MKILPAKKLHRRSVLAAYIVILLIGFYALSGFMIVPHIGKSMIPETLEKTLHRNASAGDIRLNPFTFELEISNFTVSQKAEHEDLFSFSRLKINLDAWQTLTSGALTLNEISLNDPLFTVVRRKDGKLNFQDLLEGKNATHEPEQPEKTEHTSFTFQCDNIDIQGGHAIFEDRMKGVTLISSELNIRIPSISNVEAEAAGNASNAADLSLSALIGNRTRLSVHGDLDLFQDAPHIALRIDLEKLPLRKFMPYAPDNLRISVPSGDLTLNTEFMLSAPVNATEFTASGNASVTGLSVLGPDKREIARFPEFLVSNLNYRFPSNTLDIQEILLNQPEITSSINAQGQVNLTTLIAADNAPAPKPAGSSNTTQTVTTKTAQPAVKKNEAAPGFILNLAGAELRNGRVLFTDNSREIPFKAAIAPVNLRMTGFSTNTSRPPAEVRFKASSDLNATYELKARVGLSPMSVTADVRAQGLVLPRYSAYFSRHILFDIPTGTAGFGGRLKLGDTPDGFNAQLTNGTIEVKGLDLTHRDERGSYAKVDSLDVKGIGFDLLGREIRVGNTVLAGGELNVVREANGTLNLQELVPPAPAVQEAEEKAVEAVQNRTWTVSANTVGIRNFDLAFEDKSPARPFKLETTNINLDAGPFSQDLSRPVKAELSMNIAGGRLELKADAVPDPLSADAGFAVSGFGLPVLTPFISPETHLAISKGRADMNGRLKLRQTGGDMDIVLTGNTGIKEFRASDTRTKELVLAWNAFDVEGMKFTSRPMALSIDETALIKPYIDVARDHNGTVNLTTIVKTEEGTKKTKPAKAENPPQKKEAPPALNLKIGKAVIADGEIDFADKSVTPPYEVEIADINATAAKLDLHSGYPADLSMHARINDFATIRIKGQGAMLTGAASGDAKAEIKNVSLVQFNPYSRKYLGYAIRGGKLSYTSDASIKDRNIKATNVIRLDNIELGNKVNPKPVMDVPLALGISLLKDSDGDIELDVPVSGNLDDPKFDLSKEIFATTFKLFSQVVLAPFAFFRLDFGSAETGYVPFEPGSIELTEQARSNLDKLARAVRSKPAMNLSITGYTDPAADMEGVKRYDMLHRARLYKMKKLEEDGRRVRNPDALKLDPEEYADYLGDVYSDVVGGVTWGRDVPEMEAAVMAELKVGNEELLRFGRRRAETVRQYLMVSGSISPDRLFLLLPETPAAPAEKNAPPIRADVTLNTD